MRAFEAEGSSANTVHKLSLPQKDSAHRDTIISQRKAIRGPCLPSSRYSMLLSNPSISQSADAGRRSCGCCSLYIYTQSPLQSLQSYIPAVLCCPRPQAFLQSLQSSVAAGRAAVRAILTAFEKTFPKPSTLTPKPYCVGTFQYLELAGLQTLSMSPNSPLAGRPIHAKGMSARMSQG